MKTYISASENSKYYTLDNLTPEEIDMLPDKFLCMTRSPGLSYSHYVFKVIDKSKFLSDPKRCFFLDSYWGYAFPHDVYLASHADVENYQRRKQADLEKKLENLKYEVRDFQDAVVDFN